MLENSSVLQRSPGIVWSEDRTRHLLPKRPHEVLQAHEHGNPAYYPDSLSSLLTASIPRHKEASFCKCGGCRQGLGRHGWGRTRYHDGGFHGSHSQWRTMPSNDVLTARRNRRAVVEYKQPRPLSGHDGL